MSYELEDTLVEKNKHNLLKAVQKISSLARFSYVRQPLPLGDGHALMQAAHLVGDEPVLIMFGDCLYDSATPAAKQLMETFKKYGESVIGVSTVSRENVSKFGVIGGTKLGARTLKITSLVEKPQPREAPSNLVAVGKYIITPQVFATLSRMKHGTSGEFRLIDAFILMLRRGFPLYAKILEGTWLDTGDKFNFVKATIHYGLKHPEIRKNLRTLLKKYHA